MISPFALSVALGVLMMLTLPGCGPQVSDRGPGAVRHDPIPEDAYPQKVAIEGLNNALVSGRYREQLATADEPLSVTVPVRSRVDYGVNIQYRFEFFDAQGRPLRSNQGYRFMHLEPRVEQFLEGNALDPEAVDWRLIIRPAR